MTVNAKPVPGDLCKLYRNTGTTTTPVYVEMGEISDCSSTLGRTMIPLNARCALFRPNVAGAYENMSITCTYIPGLNATNDTWILTQFFDEDQEPALWVMADGSLGGEGTAAAGGLRLPAYISGLSENQNNGAIRSFNLTLTHGYMVEGTSVVEPAWI